MSAGCLHYFAISIFRLFSARQSAIYPKRTPRARRTRRAAARSDAHWARSRAPPRAQHRGEPIAGSVATGDDSCAKDGRPPAGCPSAHSRRVAGITSPAGRSVERTGARGRTARLQPSATGQGCPGRRSLPAPVQDPSRPSRPTYAPSRRLLVLLPQQQVDPLSDEGRGGPVSRVRDHLSHPVPRRLIEAERDDQRLSRHSLSSFQ
jgi:hypothetical protein